MSQLEQAHSPFLHPLTRSQREAVLRLAQRHGLTYRQLRRSVQPGAPNSFLDYAGVTISGMYHGIERDGYVHT